MKKPTSFFALVFTMLAMCICVNASDYSFGYYMESAEYVDDNVVEATIILTSSYGNTQDVDTNLILAIYDDVSNTLLNTLSVPVEIQQPFLTESRKKIQQTIALEDTTRQRYRISVYLWDDNSITPSAEMDKFNNVCYLTSGDVIPPLSYGSTPIYVTEKGTVSVNGEPRVQIGGYVNGEFVTYTLADGVDYVAMNTNTKALSSQPINVGDAIQFIVNGSDEIAAYRHLVQVDTVNDQVSFMVSVGADTADQDNKNTATSNMKKVTMSLVELANSSALVTTGAGYTAVSIGSATNGFGYAAFGRVQRVSGRTVGIFTNVADETGESYFDVYADTALPLYVSTDSVLDGYEVKALGTIKTYMSRGKRYDKTDDLVYIFRYDGETIFQYAIDQLADNN